MSKIWAITCYFNPAGFHNRLANYRTFHKHLSVPLITVELSFGSNFELEAGDATKLIQVSSKDILWQKERLLNVAMASLPDDCEAVAYLDADVVFEKEDWAERSLGILKTVPLIQPFADFCELPPQVEFDAFQRGETTFTRRSLAAKVKDGHVASDLLQNAGARFKVKTPSAGGFAWVGRRELLDRHGFYDACIIGSGNHAIVAASYGVPDLTVKSLGMKESRTRHFLDWAEPYAKDVASEVGYISGGLFHLWHGDLENRKYRERHADFCEFDFNPYEDVRIDESGCWAWSSDTPEMHAYLRQYFIARKEDG
ncbi:hypothetical protein N9C83_05110 [Opitutales bacterium]|jgi:hypothetical protein|nr:hypothetical protein [Opitutales bacterium]